MTIAKVDLIADGLPGEYLFSDQWRLLFRNISPVNNPAILTEQNYFSVYGVMAFASDDVSRLWENGITKPIGLYRSVALSIIGENGKNVNDVSDDFLINPYTEPKQSTSNDNYTVFLSYASNPFGKFNYGVNLKGMYQGNFGDPETGLAMDFGISYRLLWHPIFGYHLIGLTLHNVFSQDLNSYSEMPQPLTLSGTYNIELFNNKANIGIKAVASDLLTKKNLFSNNNEKIERDISLLCGIRILPILRLSGYLGTDLHESINFWGFSSELNIPHVNNGRDLSLTYQYRNTMNENISGSHSIYYRVELGKHREEIYARKLARTVDISANDLYNKAMKLYFNEEYWDAYFIFKQLLVEFPDFFKNDNSSYYSAYCLEKMDFRDDALSMFNSTKKNYSMSRVVAASDLGIMRIHYRNANYGLATAQMDELNKENVLDSIRMHGFYIMGESQIALKEYRNAIQYLSIIPETHPDYCFAQYSIAVARLLNGQEYTDIIFNLENCISGNILTPQQEEIRNKAYLALGYIYYEGQALSKAVVALRLIAKKSIYYDDALLGLGWTAIKARQWTDCIDAGLSLTNTSKRIVMQCEGLLIQAYGYIMYKKYQNASDLLNTADNQCKNYNGLSPDTIFNRKFMYDNTRLSYNRLASFITPENVFPDPENKMLDTYHKDQIKIKDEIDSYLHFVDEQERLNIFERSLPKVNDDIEFAMSKVQSLLLTLPGQKIKNELNEKDRKLNNELEDLKNKMIKLEKNQ